MFFGPFSNGENHAFIPLHNKRENSPTEEENETQSLLESGQSEKWRTSLRNSLIGDLKQKKTPRGCHLIHIFLLYIFFCITEHMQLTPSTIWGTGCCKLVQNRLSWMILVSSQVQRQDPLWRPFLALLQGGSMCSLSRDLTSSQEGDAPFTQSPPFKGRRQKWEISQRSLTDEEKERDSLNFICYK